MKTINANINKNVIKWKIIYYFKNKEIRKIKLKKREYDI